MQVFASELPDRVDTKHHKKYTISADIHSGNGKALTLDNVDGIPIYRVTLRRSSQWREHVQYVQALTRYCSHATLRRGLLQFISPSLFSVPWLIQLRRQKLPLIYTHTLLGRLSTKPWKRRLQPYYWRLPFQLMDCVVVSSGVMRDALRDLGVTTRIEVISNGVNLRRFQPDPSSSIRNALRQRLGLGPNAEVILFVGPITERKGVDVLLRAWCLLAQKRPNAHLVLVGPREHEIKQGLSETGFQEALQAAITDSGAAERVLFTGPVHDVEDYYQAADLFVFPSHREGMPNVVPEAFSSGLPTVLTPFIGLPAEFGRSGKEYLMAARTPEALASAITTLLNNPQQRQQLGLQARKWAEEQMDVENSMDQYATLYRELSDRSNRDIQSQNMTEVGI